MTSYAPRDVSDRLRRMAALSDLATVRRLDTKVDMTAQAITRRLRQQSRLLAACRRWAALGASLRSARGR